MKAEMTKAVGLIWQGAIDAGVKAERERLKGLAIEHALDLDCDSRAFLDFLTAVFGKPEVQP